MLPQEDLNYYFRSAFSVTCVIFTFHERELKVLLVKRNKEPYSDYYSLPAGMVYPNDSIDQKVNTVMQENTGSKNYYLKQIRAFADASRHPLGRVVSIGYYSFINYHDCILTAREGEEVPQWFDLKAIPNLAFDHNEIIAAANRRVLAKMSTQLAGLEMLPEFFTLKQVQEMYEAALGHSLDKRNFRRKILAQEVVKETGELLSPWEESGKAPMLYTLDKASYYKMKAEGHKFELF